MSGGDVIELDESSTAVAGQAKNQLAATPAQLLQIAVQNGADLDKLERLMALQERWEANQAAQAFAQAMAAFKAADAVRIVKDKHVRFQSQKGITEYDHATIGNVVKVITEALAPHGLSHSWTTQQEGGEIRVTCKLRHRGGHFEEVTLSGNPDPSGGKNPIQAIGSTVTYLQRYTLLLITGCATSDQPDDDGRGAGEHDDIGDLLAELYECRTDASALKFWQDKRGALRGNADAYERFKQAVAQHRRALEGGAA